MTGSARNPAVIALLLGLAAFAFILGALGFQYIGGLPPCELCMWQRYPHIAAAILGIGCFALARGGLLPRSAAAVLAGLTAIAILSSGAIGVYHAGVEWHWWRGPASCTGAAFRGTGPLDLSAPVVLCDHAAWRLFGISLAGYNAIFSFAVGTAGLYLLARTVRFR